MPNIKVCGDPHCSAVWHNIPKEVTRCKDCGGRVISINQKTYEAKFQTFYFQYDYLTGEYYHTTKPNPKTLFHENC